MAAGTQMQDSSKSEVQNEGGKLNLDTSLGV